jgi:hypothetical protein
MLSSGKSQREDETHKRSMYLCRVRPHENMSLKKGKTDYLVSFSVHFFEFLYILGINRYWMNSWQRFSVGWLFIHFDNCFFTYRNVLIWSNQNTIHNGQVMKSAYQQWMDKENVVYIHNGVLFEHNEKPNHVWGEMDGTEDHILSQKD